MDTKNNQIKKGKIQRIGGYTYRADLTSDVAIEAFADTKKELLIQAALGLSSVICIIDDIIPQKKVEISVHGTDFSDLMFQWLQNVIALVDTDGLFCCKFEITSLSLTLNTMTALCYGEAITPEKGGTVVKAITYHDFKIFQKTITDVLGNDGGKTKTNQDPTNIKKQWYVWYCVDI